MTAISKPEHGSAWKALGPLLDGIAARIADGRIDAAALGKFLLAAVVTSSVFHPLVPDETGGSDALLDVPVLDDALNALIMAAGGFLYAGLVFRPLRWVGGVGSCRGTVIAAVYSVAALLPLITLLSGLWWQIGHTPLSAQYASYGGLSYLVGILCVLHKLTYRRTYAVVFAATIVGAIPIAALIAVAGGFSGG